MFELRPLLQHELKLRCRRIEQRGLLRHFQSGRDSAFVTVIDQIQSLLLDFDRLPHHSRLTIQFAQVEIVSGEFSGQHQAHIFQDRPRCPAAKRWPLPDCGARVRINRAHS